MLGETSHHLTNLPPLSPDARRFVAAFLNADQDVNELAAHLNEDFFDVIRKLCDPPIKAWITAINALKGNERRERALRALDAALTEEANPAAIRRAASRILRHLELTRPRDAKAPATPLAPLVAEADAIAVSPFDPKGRKTVARGERSEPLEIENKSGAPKGRQKSPQPTVSTAAGPCNHPAAQPDATDQHGRNPYDPSCPPTPPQHPHHPKQSAAPHHNQTRSPHHPPPPPSPPSASPASSSSPFGANSSPSPHSPSSSARAP